MHTAFLVAYIVLPILTWWRTRSLTWTVISLVLSVSVAGALVNFLIDYVLFVNWTILQSLLFVALAVPTTIAFLRPPVNSAPRKRQFTAVVLPVTLLMAFFWVVTTFLTTVPAYRVPVSFLIGHSLAEDNAKWLDFSAFLASGNSIEQAVPLGGPLQLFLVLIATLMAVVSWVSFGGVNEVMVAANTVVYSQFALMALAPLALAPFAETRLSLGGSSSNVGKRIPIPFIWLGALILSSALLLATNYGHLTWQFVAVIGSLWVVAFLVPTQFARARLFTSLAIAVTMTVWLPMNMIAIVVVVGWLVVLVTRGLRERNWDFFGLTLTIVVAAALWQPVSSSLAFLMDTATNALSENGGMAGGIPAALSPASFTNPFAFISSTLLAASGGTERAGPIFAILAAVSVLAAAIYLTRREIGSGAYVRFIPIGLLTGFAILLQAIDQWSTGSAPNYGSDKFTFLVVVILTAASMPVGLMMITPGGQPMTVARWVGVGAVIFLLLADSLLIRAVAAARPQQWSPPIPFDNPQSYWWPAEVNGDAAQPIATHPVGCVYLPQGAKAPSAILDSQLSDAQRVYSCSRLLAGLAGEDAGAQPIVDWLRREWLSNARAWDGVYGYLENMPDSVLDRPMILLDDGSNVIGLESMRSLLERHPADAWSKP